MTKKANLEVIMSVILPYKKGDFGEIVNEVEGKMYFPLPVYEALENMLGGWNNIMDTYSLVSCIITFPTCFKEIQNNLGWTDEEFKKAEEKLMRTLQQYTPEEYFNFIPKKRAYGAIPPDPKDIGKTAQQLINKKKN